MRPDPVSRIAHFLRKSQTFGPRNLRRNDLSPAVPSDQLAPVGPLSPCELLKAVSQRRRGFAYGVRQGSARIRGMITEPIKQEMLRDLRQVIGMYAQDLAAMSPELLQTRPGKALRAPIDFTYEVAVVNRRMAARLRGENPGPSDQSLAMAPERYDVHAFVLGEFHAAGAELLAAAEALPAERWHETPVGLSAKDGSMIGLVTFAAVHMTYHDGQLNLIQSIVGDQQIHWGG